MTIEQAIETVRIALGDRSEHHSFCNSRLSDRKHDTCDCYAEKRQVPHKAMDVIEDFIREKMVEESSV